MKRIYLFFALLIASTSCQDSKTTVADILTGDWSIEQFIYNNTDLRGCMPLNMLQFYDDKISSLPATPFCDSLELRDRNFKATHEIIYKNKSDILLIFKTENKLFKDTFNLQFVDDKRNKCMRLELTSAKVYILCTKGSFESYLKLRQRISKVAQINIVE